MEELDEFYITKKQVVQIVSNYLEPLMTENNFKFHKTKDAFIIKTEFGFQEISVNVKNFWPLKQELNIHIATINYQINQIRMMFFTNAKKDNFTMSKWLVLPNSNELKFKELYTDNDIEIAKVEAYDLIEKEAFIYLEKYSHLENIIEYSKNIKNSHFISISLISLKLIKDNRYNDFKEETLKEINNSNSKLDKKEALLSLIEYLDKKND